MDENLSRGYCQLNSPQLNRKWKGGTPSRDSITPPRDPCNCVYLALVLAGAGFLLPYNSFITAVDYYQARYPGTTIIFDISLTYIVVAFVSVIINNALVEVRWPTELRVLSDGFTSIIIVVVVVSITIIIAAAIIIIIVVVTNIIAAAIIIIIVVTTIIIAAAIIIVVVVITIIIVVIIIVIVVVVVIIIVVVVIIIIIQDNA